MGTETIIKGWGGIDRTTLGTGAVIYTGEFVIEGARDIGGDDEI